MTYIFDCMCWVLDGSYIILGLISAIQLTRLQKRDEGLSCRWCCFNPATVQQLVHILILALCGVRAAFFICAIRAWNPLTGAVYRDKLEFYSLDEISNTLFFSLTSILALFWAELYYISIDRADIYQCIVRPVTYIMNTIAFVGVIICSILVSKFYANDVDYIFLQYTILITTTYLFAAIMFSYYAYVAALELECVPLPITARRNRLFSLRLLACISIFALGLKASATVYMTGRSVATNSAVSLFLVYFYFFFCEILPICVILTFYRVETLNNETADEKDNEFYENVERQAQNTSSNSRFSGSSSSPEVIDAIITRLSLESGFTGDTINMNRQDNEGEHWGRDSGETDGLLPAPRGSRRYQNLSL